MPFRLAIGGAAGLSLAFLLLPILALVPMSLSRTTWLAFPPDALTLEWYGRVLADREWREAAGTSLAVAALAALLAALLGTPAGLALGRGRGAPGLRRALRAVVLLPVMVPGRAGRDRALRGLRGGGPRGHARGAGARPRDARACPTSC